MRSIRWRQFPVGVIQICCIAPDPFISAAVYVSPALISTEGDIFHPRPSSRAARAPVPSVAIPPFPFSPVGFSGLMDRDFAFESLERFPIPPERPLNEPCADASCMTTAARRTMRINPAAIPATFLVIQERVHGVRNPCALILEATLLPCRCCLSYRPSREA